MATTLFFRDTAAADLSASVDKVLSLSRGASATSKITTTTASGNLIQVTDGAGGTTIYWWSNPLQAVTIAGQISANLRGLESAIAVNAGVLYSVGKTAGDGSGATGIASATVSTEFTTSETAKTVLVTPAAGVALSAGDRLRIGVFIDNVGTMGAGTATFFLDGPTGGASGDSFITFTETILEQSAAAFAPPPFQRRWRYQTRRRRS